MNPHQPEIPTDPFVWFVSFVDKKRASPRPIPLRITVEGVISYSVTVIPIAASRRQVLATVDPRVEC